jgi:hypothetical protein
MVPDCTLVTACYDLTKYNNKCRDKLATIKNMRSLLETPCYLIIFTDNYLYNVIHDIRNSYNLSHLTKYVISEITELDVYKFVDVVKINRIKYHPTKDDRTCAESHLICCSKFDFVLYAINNNPFHTSKFGWFDSNVGTNFSKICTNYKSNMLLRALTNATDKMHIQILNVVDKKYIQPKYLHEYYNQYRWVVCGSFFTVGKNIGIKIMNNLNNIFINTTCLGYGHGEEMFYLEILDKYYNDIVKSYGDYSDIINNFVHINNNIEYILNFIIKNYFSVGYHRECYDCCEKVLTSYDNYDIEMNVSQYFTVMFYYYMSSCYHNTEKSVYVANKIMKLVNENYDFKCEYEKNKNYYDNQLKFVEVFKTI